MLVDDPIEGMVSTRVVGPKGAFTLSPVRLNGGAVRFIIKIKGKVVVKFSFALWRDCTTDDAPSGRQNVGLEARYLVSIRPSARPHR